MTHLTRAGILVLMAVGAFLVLRLATTQATVPAIGLVRDDNALQWASKDVRFGNATLCASCHGDIDMEWSHSAHSGQSCESCHGPGDRHMANGAILGPAQELCATCHAKIIGRPSYFPTVNLPDHFPQQACNSCHDPHAPAAAFPKIPHNVQGREDCLACHGVKGIAEIPPNHVGRPVELCLGCHKPAAPAADTSAERTLP
jgi:hypothetical protein